jgi:hypothetical protein
MFFTYKSVVIYNIFIEKYFLSMNKIVGAPPPYQRCGSWIFLATSTLLPYLPLHPKVILLLLLVTLPPMNIIKVTTKLNAASSHCPYLILNIMKSFIAKSLNRVSGGLNFTQNISSLYASLNA